MTSTIFEASPPSAGHLGGAAELVATGVCAWFSGRLVLDSVDLTMSRSQVTALIGPFGLR